MKSKFENYFPGLEVGNFDQIRKSLSAQPKENILAITEDEQLIDLSCDTSLKLKFPTVSFPAFWIYVQSWVKRIKLESYYEHSSPFATSYLCDTEFSAVATIKSIYQPQINVECVIRLAIS